MFSKTTTSTTAALPSNNKCPCVEAQPPNYRRHEGLQEESDQEVSCRCTCRRRRNSVPATPATSTTPQPLPSSHAEIQQCNPINTIGADEMSDDASVRDAAADRHSKEGADFVSLPKGPRDKEGASERRSTCHFVNGRMKEKAHEGGGAYPPPIIVFVSRNSNGRGSTLEEERRSRADLSFPQPHNNVGNTELSTVDSSGECGVVVGHACDAFLSTTTAAGIPRRLADIGKTASSPPRPLRADLLPAHPHRLSKSASIYSSPLLLNSLATAATRSTCVVEREGSHLNANSAPAAPLCPSWATASAPICGPRPATLPPLSPPPSPPHAITTTQALVIAAPHRANANAFCAPPESHTIITLWPSPLLEARTVTGSSASTHSNNLLLFSSHTAPQQQLHQPLPLGRQPFNPSTAQRWPRRWSCLRPNNHYCSGRTQQAAPLLWRLVIALRALLHVASNLTPLVGATCHLFSFHRQWRWPRCRSPADPRHFSRTSVYRRPQRLRSYQQHPFLRPPRHRCYF